MAAWTQRIQMTTASRAMIRPEDEAAWSRAVQQLRPLRGTDPEGSGGPTKASVDPSGQNNSGDVDYSKMSIDEIRAKFGIAAFQEGLTEIKIDGETTVGDKINERFIQQMRDDLKNGKIAKDSKEAQLLDLIDASGAAANGYDLLPYIEAIEPNNKGSTYRESPDEPIHLEGADVSDLVDADKIADKIQALMQDPDIAKRYEAATRDTINSDVPPEKLDALKKQTLEAFFNPDGSSNTRFEDNVIALYENAGTDDALKDAVEKEVQNYFETLKVVDPDRYVARKEEFDRNLMTYQLNDYILHPEKMSPEAVETAYRSTIDIMQQGLNSLLQLGDKGGKTANEIENLQLFINKGQDLNKQYQEKIDKETDPEKKQKLIDERKNLFLAFMTVGNDALPGASNGSVTSIQDKIDTAFAKHLAGAAEDTRSSFRNFVNAGASSGMFSAATGMMSLLSGVLQITGASGPGLKDMSADQQMAVARDFIGALSFGGDIAKFGGGIVALMGAEPDPDNPGKVKIREDSWKGQKLVDWIGNMDDTIPEIWGQSKPQDALAKEIVGKISAASDKLAAQDWSQIAGYETYDNLSESDKQRLNNSILEYGERLVGSEKAKLSAGDIATKIGRTFSKVMFGAGFDIAGGVLDIVTGARALKNAVTDAGRAQAIFQTFGGAPGTFFGLVGAFKLFEPQAGWNMAARFAPGLMRNLLAGWSAAIRVAGPVTGVIGAVFGAVAAAMAEAVRHARAQKLTDEQGDFMFRLGKLGVTKEGWEDKFEYARYATYMYGTRDAPTTEAMWNYQEDEFRHFKATPAEDGSSLIRLAPNRHFDADFNSQSLYELYLGADLNQFDDRARPWAYTDLDDNRLSNTFEYFANNVGRIYNIDFYDKNRAVIDEIARNWDKWNGKDAIVSAKDLNKIKDDTGRSDAEREAARWLLDPAQAELFRLLDAIKSSGAGQDQKISTTDINLWLSRITDVRA